MEDLCKTLDQLSFQKSWYNNSMYLLDCIENSIGDAFVYTREDIKDGSFIGYIEGKRNYTWELLPHRYCIWLNDSYVIDCRETPRCIGAMVRESYEDSDHLHPNCELAFSYTRDYTIEVYIRSTRYIYAGEELVLKKEDIYE